MPISITNYWYYFYMKEWREYACEANHFWEMLKEKGDPELPNDLQCRCGQEAVTVRKVKAKGIMVNIMPMLRELDSVTGKVGFANKYYLVVESLDGDFKRISNKVFSKDEVVDLAKCFIGLEKKTVERLWVLKKLGNSINRVES